MAQSCVCFAKNLLACETDEFDDDCVVIVTGSAAFENELDMATDEDVLGTVARLRLKKE